MKIKATSKIAAILLAFLFLVVPCQISLAQSEEATECPFSTSLHHTGEGMRYWYEEQGGFKSVADIPYAQLGCESCHVQTCSQCHTEKEDGKCSYSADQAKQMETCLTCHSRAKSTFGLSKEAGSLDVHISQGMNCSDCHKGADVHGDGTYYHSMRDPGAVKASCADCHEPNEEIRAHTVHNGKLACAACHISNSVACLNCHLDNFLKTGTKKGSFIAPDQNWVLLINYQGKVTSGSVQTLFYKGKKFIAYAPYFTHAVQPKGKVCTDCHANEAVTLIEQSKKVPMAEFKDGRVVSYRGVVPLVPEQLYWRFFDKEGENWVPVKDEEAPIVQFVGHGTPLSADQIKKMAHPYKK